MADSPGKPIVLPFLLQLHVADVHLAVRLPRDREGLLCLRLQPAKQGGSGLVSIAFTLHRSPTCAVLRLAPIGSKNRAEPPLPRPRGIWLSPVGNSKLGDENLVTAPQSVRFLSPSPSERVPLPGGPTTFQISDPCLLKPPRHDSPAGPPPAGSWQVETHTREFGKQKRWSFG